MPLYVAAETFYGQQATVPGAVPALSNPDYHGQFVAVDRSRTAYAKDVVQAVETVGAEAAWEDSDQDWSVVPELEHMVSRIPDVSPDFVWGYDDGDAFVAPEFVPEAVIMDAGPGPVGRPRKNK